MLLAAIVGGHAARWFHVPRVIGFMLGGITLRVVLFELLSVREGEPVERQLQAAAAPLRAVKDLALGLILFTIGSTLERYTSQINQLFASHARFLAVSVQAAIIASF